MTPVQSAMMHGLQGGGSIWDRAARGMAVISSPPTPAAFATVGPGGVIIPSRTSLFQISEPPDKAEAMVVTLVPPVSQGGSAPGFNGAQIQPQLGLYAVVRWGSQAQPAMIEVDFAQGVAFPIWSNFITVDAINDQPYPTSSLPWSGPTTFTAGTMIQVGPNVWVATATLTSNASGVAPVAFSQAVPPATVPDGVGGPLPGIWTLATAPNVASYLGKGTYSLGIPRRTRIVTLGGIPITPAHTLTQTTQSDLMTIPPFAQSLSPFISPNAQVDPTTLFASLPFLIIFWNTFKVEIGSQYFNGSINPNINIPSDAAYVSIINLTYSTPPQAIQTVRFVFNLAL